MNIIKREASIFVYSSISSDYPELVEILTNGKKYPQLTKKEFDNLDPASKGFITNRFSYLFKNAANEWNILDADVPNNDMSLRCQLCGQRHLKWISTIKNKKNGMKLTIGSNCIKHYGDEFKGINGEKFDELAINNYRIQNEKILEDKSPGILSDFDKFSNLTNEYKIIRKDLEDKYKRIKQELSKLYKVLNQKKTNYEKIMKLIEMREEVINFTDEFEKYKKFAETYDFGINLKIINWIYDNDYDPDLVWNLKSEGKIGIGTIASIKEPSFMKKMILKMDDLIKKNNMILKNKFDKTTFSLIINKRPNIVLNVNSAKFINKYKMYLYDGKETTIDIQSVLNISNIKDINSMKSALDVLLTTEIKKIIEIKDTNAKYDELALINVRSKDIYVIPYNAFINKFIFLIYKTITESDLLTIIDYITSNSTKYTQKEYQEHQKKINF